MNQHMREISMVMERMIQVEDKGLILEMPFKMLSATEQLDIKLAIEPLGEEACVIDLGFKDADGMRAWSGGTDICFRLGRGISGWNCLLSELETESEWAVLLNAYEVPQAGCRVTLILTCQLMSPCPLKRDRYSEYFPSLSKMEEKFQVQ